MREKIEESGSLGVAMKEDSTLGIVDDLLKNKMATPDQIINALCTQKVYMNNVAVYQYVLNTE